MWGGGVGKTVSQKIRRKGRGSERPDRRGSQLHIKKQRGGAGITTNEHDLEEFNEWSAVQKRKKKKCA